MRLTWKTAINVKYGKVPCMVLRFPFVPCPFRVHNCVKCIIAFLSYICMSMTLIKTIIIIIILEVEYILIFYKNCIFSTLLKVSGKPADSGNICFIGFVFSMEDISTKKNRNLKLRFSHYLVSQEAKNTVIQPKIW